MANTVKTGSNVDKRSVSLDRRICVAPMMDYTDRHCRYFLRLLSPSTLLYTEMITAAALVRGNVQRLLDFDAAEHPLALQLGGCDPAELAAAARMGEAHGYDEINLNCGCPSDRVKSGRFGACLMGTPALVADCVAAMRAAVNVPVTVKCRIGIEPMPQLLQDDYEFLQQFIATVAAAGCEVFVVHARKAMLNGLTPKENREIPPLRYELVRQLRSEFPNLTFILNGGIRTVAEVKTHLHDFHGVMLGREAYSTPYVLADLHRVFVDPSSQPPNREEVIERYAAYVEARLSEGDRLQSLVRHVHGLYSGLPRVRTWRRFLSEQASKEQATAKVLMDALRIVQAA
jgi:tRNA-dihydrouridine synthase A